MAERSTKSSNYFSVMKWTSDGNRLSVHHLKHIVEPKRDFDSYSIGDEGLAVYPGYAGKWAFVIMAVGETKSEMDKWLSEYLMNFKESNLTDDVQHFQKSKKHGTPKPKSNQEKAEAMSVTNWLNIRNNNRKTTPLKAKTPIDRSAENPPTKRSAENIIDANSTRDTGRKATPVKAKTPTKRSAEKTPTKRSADKTPTKRSADKTPTKRSAEKIPTKRSAEKTPTKRSAENITDAHSTRDTGRHVTPTKKIKGDQSEEISFLKEEIYKLKRRVRKLEDREKKAEEKDGCPTRDELSKMVALEWNPYAAAKTLLCSLFSQSEILMHSVSGKAPNSRVKAKPKFDSRKYSIFTDIIKEKFPTLHTKDITSKVLAVQKNLQRESAKMEKNTRSPVNTQPPVNTQNTWSPVNNQSPVN